MPKLEHDNSVEFYSECLVKMRVCFPHGKVDCRHCPFIRHREAFVLFQCALTEELIEKYELDQRGHMCPVELQETPF